MSNKINGLNGTPLRTSEASAVARTRSSTTGEGARPQPHAPGGVQITESARQLAALEATLSRLSQVDEARVAKIRKAIFPLRRVPLKDIQESVRSGRRVQMEALPLDEDD